MPIPLGQHPAPHHVIAHVSDTHLLAGGRELYGSIATETHLRQAMTQLERLAVPPQAIVITGDLADLGEPDAYERLKTIIEPSAGRMGARIIWVMGNHDEREPYSQLLFGLEPNAEPQDRVYDIDGLRIISFDTTVPGYHHGDVTEQQLAWLADVLSTPAPHGSILAVHHPPVPTPLLWAMELLELRSQAALAEVLRGSDLRAILGGHLHYSSHSTFAGIPVSVAAATCYTLQLSMQERLFSGVDAHQAVNLVHVYDDQVVHSIVPIGEHPETSAVSIEHAARIESMTDAERLELFSAKDSPVNRPQR